jgi:molybdopterin/thiamine biosynthesis adenylyltransferase
LLRTRLHDPRLESCAVLTANLVNLNSASRLVARDVYVAPPDAYIKRNTSRAILHPTFIAPIVKQAVRKKQVLIFVHTHPWESGLPEFSAVDDEGEQTLLRFLSNRGVPDGSAAIVMGQERCRARALGRNTPIAVITIGQTREVAFAAEASTDASATHDRQIRLLGTEAQIRLRKLRIGIVGLGGTGSVVAQQLAHLGISNFILIDPDTVEETNLNRLVGASQADVGETKVAVAERQIKLLSNHSDVKTIRGNVLDEGVAQYLKGMDFIFCCTDSQASRAVVNQLAYQYLVPTIDIGVSITTGENQVRRINGRAQLLAPGEACLTCQELLDSNAVRQEFMSAEQQKNDPYFLGGGEPQPAVISLNSTLSSLAVTMFLSTVAGLPSRARHVIYDAIIGSVRVVRASQSPACVVCSRRGALGKANEWPLPVRLSVR